MKLTVVLAVLIGTLVVACSTAAPAPAEPTPNIDATVEAKLAQERAVDATVEARLKEERASQPTSIPSPTNTQAAMPTYTPHPTYTPYPTNTPQPTNTAKPAPTNTPTLVPTATSVPTPTPRPIPTPTPRPMPTLEPCGGRTSLGNSPRNPPHVFVGAVQVNGRAATDGTEVSAWVDDVEVARTYASGGDYSILIDVCRDGPKRMNGARVSFKIGGKWTAESWGLVQGGGDVLNLNQLIGIATPTPVPTPTLTPAPTSTPVPTPRRLIGQPVIAEDGIEVTLKSVTKAVYGNVTTVTISYTLKNTTNDLKDEDGFRLYIVGGGGYPQYGFFNSLLPGKSRNGGYTFNVQSPGVPLAIGYPGFSRYGATWNQGDLVWDID